MSILTTLSHHCDYQNNTKICDVGATCLFTTDELSCNRVRFGA